MLLVAFHANRLNTDWNAAKEWEVSQILKLPAGLEAAFEVHCAAISNSSIGLHGESAGGAAHHRLAFLGKDDSKRKRGMGRRLYHGATCLGERHSTRNRHGKTLHQNVLPANSAK